MNAGVMFELLWYPAALKDTERLKVQYSGPLMGSKSEEVFIQKFIQAASTKAGIRE